MIKSDNKIYQDMVRGMMGLQVPSGGSVAFATLGSNSDTFGPEGQDDQGKVSSIALFFHRSFHSFLFGRDDALSFVLLMNADHAKRAQCRLPSGHAAHAG